MSWPTEDQMALMGSIQTMLARIEKAHLGTPIMETIEVVG